MSPMPDRRHGIAGAAVSWLRRRLRWGRPSSFWQALAGAFGEVPESSFQLDGVPLRPDSRLHAIDPGSSELEILQLLHALVCVYKPERVLETGTFRGFGALTIAHALELNGAGTLTTIDCDHAALRLARRHVRVFAPGLRRGIDFVEADSLEWLRRQSGAPFDLAFLDSRLDLRVEELEILLERELLAPGALCMLHDTAMGGLREPAGAPAEWHDAHTWRGLDRLEEIARANGALRFTQSRGFLLIQMRNGVRS